MSSAERGRFCGKCNKVVRDFTNTSDEELIKIFSDQQSKMCGRFLSSQVKKGNYQESFWEFTKRTRIRKFAASFVSLLGLKLFSIAHAEAQTTELKNPSTSDLKKAGIEVQKNFSNDSSQLQISGTLRDSKTHEGIPFATIVIIEKGKQIAVAESDNNGHFIFNIPKGNFISGEFDISVAYLGYDRMMIEKIPIRNFNYLLQLDLQMRESSMMMGEIILSSDRLVNPENTSTGKTFHRDELKHLPW